MITDLQLTAWRGGGPGRGRRGAAPRAGARTILLTGHHSDMMAAAARDLGVDALVHKPRPLAEIEEIIQSLLVGGVA